MLPGLADSPCNTFGKSADRLASQAGSMNLTSCLRLGLIAPSRRRFLVLFNGFGGVQSNQASYQQGKEELAGDGLQSHPGAGNRRNQQEVV